MSNSRGFLVAIDVGGTNIKIMIMSPSFDVLAFSSITTGAARGYEIISDAIIREIELLFHRNGIDKPAVAAIAMGLPGTVFSKQQKTGCLSVLHWDQCNPCKKLGDYFKAPYRIENDANLNALGEYHFGINKRIQNMALLTLGTGIGGGIIIDGALYRGGQDQAAEIGHMTIEANNGERCLCGGYGHFEAYCSGTALRNYTLDHLAEYPESVLHQYIAEKREFDNAMLDQGVRVNDSYSKKVFERFLFYLAAGIGNIITLLSPELVVLAGGIANAGDILVNPLNQTVKHSLMDEKQMCPIVTSVLGSKAGVYGACAMASIIAADDRKNKR